MSESRKHILLLAFPAYGHMIPLLELGKKISKHHHVSFAVSIIKLQEMQKRELFVEDPEYDLELVGIDDGYLTEFDVRMCDPDDHFKVFEDIFKAVMPPTTDFMEAVINRTVNMKSSRPVDVVIADSFIGPPLQVCHRKKVPFYLFNTSNAGLAIGIATVKDDDPLCDPEDADPFMRPPVAGAPPQAMPAQFHQLLLEMQGLTPKCAGLIVNSFREIEEDALTILNKLPIMTGIPISCIGPLVPPEKEEKASNRLVEEKVKKWLDAKEKRSVLYVSFGSIAVLAPEQLQELGKGLLLLNKPCILSLRDGFRVHLPQEIRDQIATQMENTSGQFFVLPWSPQKMILMHPATRVFVSHCGWNSTLESFSGGVPIVGWPMFAEQLINADWIEKHSLGRLIHGTGVKPERVVPADEVKKTIAEVAGWGKGETVDTPYTTTAQTWKEKIQTALAPNGSSQKEFDELVKFEQK